MLPYMEWFVERNFFPPENILLVMSESLDRLGEWLEIWDKDQCCIFKNIFCFSILLLNLHDPRYSVCLSEPVLQEKVTSK